MKRTLVRLLAGAILALAVPAGALSPAAADGTPSDPVVNSNPAAPCSAMTDSITRLYLAFFGRTPDSAGFNSWVGAYQSGQMNLEEIAQVFADSEEFAGNDIATNTGYINWIYRNLLDRDPTNEELDHWVTALDGGYPRGSVMVTFTESSDYVARTNTAVPLAGYRRWYPKGTHWYCNMGTLTVATNPLVGEVWADFYFQNRGEGDDQVALRTLEEDGRRNVTMVSTTVPPPMKIYDWDGVFTGDGDYGRYLEVEAGRSTDWIVVFYPRSIGEDRFGWQIS